MHFELGSKQDKNKLLAKLGALKIIEYYKLIMEDLTPTRPEKQYQKVIGWGKIINTNTNLDEHYNVRG